LGHGMQLSDRIGKRIKLQDVHVLLAVVQAGSMGKAARHLNTSQPNISKSIADLERTLGVRLLDRHQQGIEPTEYGRALLNGGVAVFDELRQTVKHIEFLADPAVGEVCVGCNPTLAASVVSAVVDQVSHQYPRAKFRLVTAYVETLYRELMERNVDFLIARRSGPIVDERLDYEFLFNDSYSVAVGVLNPLARKRKIELAELINEPWVLPSPETTAGSVAVAAFHTAGLEHPSATVIAEPAELRISLLANGRFISIFPDSVLRFSARRRELKVLNIDEPLGHVPVGIITLKNRTISPLAQLFIAGSRELMKQIEKRRD
jgi:DNA-binding transcriptional LysR family regulator